MATLERLEKERRLRQNRYFSEGFKRQKVKDYECNRVSIAEISREYEVNRSAVYKWIYKYSIHYQRKERQIVERKSDTRKIKELQDRIKELERIVGQKQIQIDFHAKMIELAEEKFEIKIKKKFGSKPLFGSGPTGSNIHTSSTKST